MSYKPPVERLGVPRIALGNDGLVKLPHGNPSVLLAPIISPNGAAEQPDTEGILRKGHQLPRCVINAVGSTAVKTAWQTRRFLNLMAPGAVDDSLSFICMDAAAQQSSDFEVGREFLHLTVEDAEGIMENLPRHTMLNKELPGLSSMDAIAKIQDGVHGQPIFGSFALIKNAREVTQAVTAQLTRLGGDLTVVHIVSPLGGVAPGMLAREVYLVRDLCREVLASQAHLHVCFFLLPVKGEQSRSSDREELIQIRNFYFALRQIETFTTPGQIFTSQMAETQIRSTAPIFDLIIGWGPNLERNHVATDLAELESSAAASLARYVAGGFDEVFRQRMADHKSLITGQVNGKNRRLAINGQISLEVPIRQIHEELSTRSTRNLCERIVQLARIEPKPGAADERAEDAKVTVGAGGMQAETLTARFSSAMKKNVQGRPKSLSLGQDPLPKVNDHLADLLTELNIADGKMTKGRLNLTAERWDYLCQAAPHGTSAALPWWTRAQAVLDGEAANAAEASKKAKHSAQHHRRDCEEQAQKAQNIAHSIFAIFRSAEPCLNAAVDSMYKARDEMLAAKAYDASAQVLRDLVSEIRKRRKALAQLSRTVLKSYAIEGEAFSDPAPQTIRVVAERHLNTLEQAFTTDDHSQSITHLEKHIGPMIDWGIAFTDKADAFYQHVLQAKYLDLTDVLETSAIDYLAGPLATALGIDGMEVVTSARKRLAPSANYTLAAVADEYGLPEVVLASFAASKDTQVNKRMQQMLDIRENCIQEKGHPEQLTLMVAHFGATLGMLTSATKWRNSFQKALELEGDAVLQIFADRELNGLGEPAFEPPAGASS